MFKQIIVTLDRFEGDFGVLRHRDHEILWPLEDLPADAKEGEVITLTAMNEKEATKSRGEMAKTILNDILNSTLSAPGTLPSTQEEHETLEEERLQQISKKLTELNEIEKRKGNE